jgi:hypothetical protein
MERKCQLAIKAMGVKGKIITEKEDSNKYAADLYIEWKSWKSYKKYIRKIYFISEPFKLIKENKLRIIFDCKKCKVIMNNKLMWEFYVAANEYIMDWLLRTDNFEQRMSQPNYDRIMKEYIFNTMKNYLKNKAEIKLFTKISVQWGHHWKKKKVTLKW